MKKLPLIIILLYISYGSLKAQEPKIVGYLPYYRFALLEQIQMDKLTHLCIAFANPNMSGELSVADKDIRPVIEAANNQNVKVLISLAGGALTAEWAAAWEHLIKPQNRSAFIHKLVLYIESYGLEGIDVDLEWSHVTANYTGFVLELGDSLRAHNKLMTAALPGTYRYPQVTSAVINAYDFINLMAYDLTGSWAPQNAGPHSPYSFAVSSINYWKNQGASSEKLVLGVPFYGYDFSNPNNVTSFTYQSMIATNSAYADVDEVGKAYYNGRPTIRRKTELALEEVAGVMIWELGQDSFDEYSLLDVIYNRINEATNTDTELANYFSIGPNPFRERVQIHAHNFEKYQIRLRDLNGRILKQQSVWGDIQLQLSHLPTGVYILHIEQGAYTFRQKLIKRN